MTTTTTAAVQTRRTHQRPSVVELAKEYAVLILTGLILVILAFASPSCFTFPNLVNLLNQNAPLVIIAAAGTCVIISGQFVRAVGGMFGGGGGERGGGGGPAGFRLHPCRSAR